MRKKIRKTLKYSIFSIILIVIVALIFPTWTPKIKGENSISMLEQVEINGTGHEVMIRGVDRTNPILIFVHGGPGCSEIPYVRKYQKELEQHFTVVHYDQRGSGKSYHFFEDYSNLTTDVLVDDLLALRDYVSKELGQEKVILIGHSFGTYIGMKAAAKAPTQFHAYIGIGQMANTLQSELESLEYTYEQAKQAGNEDDVKKLELIRSSIEQGKELTPRILLQKYGGAARLINENRDYISGFLLNPEYNGLDMIRFYSGMFSSQDILLREAFDQNLPDIVDHLEIPTYFVTGKYDYMTTANAARDYFDVLDAPIKDFIVFNESAHYPQFEEKEKFVKWLNELF
ncbi:MULTISPECIES: alpha/beta fold hydrolase [Paenibacillus]|uniref:alpha/beta fold hydrolase n=1 Tax=Paenibacillus TaxID=44249 RepID=UPI00096DEBDA|nr:MULTISPECIES: alpha/beta hydrolase [Paenibacillus]MCP1426316.1 pimeloyl-ACP methyl ester carboxylesterase [Paenibacillus xylanexedens]OMF47791.1 alpha/beta hydrolase [Paenibacillus amylolyticus]WFA87566.1 alpha/beta hydrolase [Paenibacillus amylolyticus]